MISSAKDGLGNYWAAGANSGTCYYGRLVPTAVQIALPNTRAIQVVEGNLFFTTGSDRPGVWQIPGTPVSPGAVPQLVIDSSPAGSPYAFAFNPPFTVAYVADDSPTETGGIQRWDFIEGQWQFTYAFSGLVRIGARGLSVDFSSAPPRLYATTAETSSNRLVTIIDTGASATVNTLAFAGPEQVFRGVAFTPEPKPIPRFISVAVDSNGLQLVWTSTARSTYILEYTDDLAHPNWKVLTTLIATSPVTSATDANPSAVTQRFYRLRLDR